MNQAVEPYISLSRNLGAVALAGFDEFFSFQLDHAQALATRSSKQLNAALSVASRTSEPERFPETMQQWMGGANTLFRDAIVFSIDYQIEMLRLMQKQAAETREAIAESGHGQVAAIGKTSASGRSQRGGKTSGSEQKLAA